MTPTNGTKNLVANNIRITSLENGPILSRICTSVSRFTNHEDLYIFPSILTILLPQRATSLSSLAYTERKGERTLTFIKTSGIGINTIDKNASVELAHPTPRFLYIADANRGNPAPNTDRKRSLPASTDAA